MSTCKECLHFDVCCEDWANQTEGKFTADDYKINMADKVPCANHFKSAADVVEVKHGKWTIKRDEYDCEYMVCSCCAECFYDGDNDTVDRLPKYCSECGAKMDGGKK